MLQRPDCQFDLILREFFHVRHPSIRLTPGSTMWIGDEQVEVTFEAAKLVADLRDERVWEEPSDADESKLLVSRTLKPGIAPQDPRRHHNDIRMSIVPRR